MVASVSAHAAVDKACDLLGIHLRKVPYDPITFRVNLTAIQQAIGPNTIMMYASAPQYPHGAIDNIPALSAIAVRYSIGLDIDCCLGGFILPFAKKLAIKQIPDFDFRLPGVSSMSLVTHKYGYALKGTSVVLYKSIELRRSQYFCYGDWPGGLYSTPTILGSRSGGLIAQTWASLVTMGWEGFLEHTKGILETTVLIENGIKEQLPQLKIFGEVDAMIVCFGIDSAHASSLDIYMIGQTMHEKGWILNAIPQPPSLHICVTYANVGKHEKFLNDLKESIEENQNHPKAKSGFAVIYGTAASVPPGPVNELLRVYNDVVLKT
jgi:glutamate/tyrosine decarboxylase-like PLP-dependent enzyme